MSSQSTAFSLFLSKSDNVDTTSSHSQLLAIPFQNQQNNQNNQNIQKCSEPSEMAGNLLIDLPAENSVSGTQLQYAGLCIPKREIKKLVKIARHS